MASSALQLVPAAFEYGANEALASFAQRSFNTWSIVFSHPEDFVPYEWKLIVGSYCCAVRS